jgi:hypothetical protein
MAHTETVYSIMERVQIATKHQVGDVMAHWEIWNPGVSAVNNSYKELNNNVEERRLVKENNYYKLPEVKSGFKPHSQLLSACLISILKFNRDCKIFREHTIAEKGLRPDALVCLIKENLLACFVLEAMDTETESYSEMKKNVWQAWDDAPKYLSELFGYVIPHFDIVTSDDLKAYLEGL